jgi:hypothetical protein
MEKDGVGTHGGVQMRKREPNCKDCKVPKTPENTSINSLGNYRHICKSCDSIRANNKRMAKLSIGELKRLHKKHLDKAAKVQEKINECYQDVPHLHSTTPIGAARGVEAFQYLGESNN